MTHLDVVTINDLWKENIDGYFPFLIEIYNPDFVWTEEEKASYAQEDCYLRLVADINTVKYKSKAYLPCSFDFTPPETDGSKVGNAQISISALDARVKLLLRSISLPSEVKVVAMFAKVERESQKPVYKFVEMNSKTFLMRGASSNQTTATFNLEFDNALSQNIPYDLATSDRVPAGTSATASK